MLESDGWAGKKQTGRQTPWGVSSLTIPDETWPFANSINHRQDSEDA